MKKIVFEQPVSEIHIDDISLKDVIIVKKKGNDFGVIIHHNGTWLCKTPSHSYSNDLISFVIKWCGANCEFYVLD